MEFIGITSLFSLGEFAKVVSGEKIEIKARFSEVVVRFLSIRQYDLRILSARITCIAIIKRGKRHKEFSSGKP